MNNASNSNTMVENKHSLYDDNDPPLVHATYANNETDLLLHHSNVVPSAPPEDLVNRRHESPPPSYRDVLVVNTPNRPREFIPSDNQGGHTARDQTNTNEQTEEEPRDPDRDRLVASGAAGAVIGLLLGGPVIAAITGFGAAYATRKDGTAGDAARALGDVALVAKEKALEVDQKHHVVDKSKKAAAEAWEKAQALDRQHHILDQLKEALIFSWNLFVDFVRRHKLLERGVEGVGRGFEYVAERASRGSESAGGNSSTAQDQTERDRSDRR